MALIGLIAAIQNWTVPPRIWLALSAALFLWAIVQAFHEVRVARDDAIGVLSKKRNFQRIADTLTTEYAFAVHELAGKSPRYDAERDEAFLGKFNVWFDGIKAWNEKVRVMLGELECSPQEQARFWTIDELKPGMMIRGDRWEVAMRMHDTRVARLSEIIEAYANKAEGVESRRK
jgi:hypothetical protein